MTEWPASPGCDCRETRHSVVATLLSKGLAETFCDPYARVVVGKLTMGRGREILHSALLKIKSDDRGKYKGMLWKSFVV